MTAVEPTRDRVEAYEKALGCGIRVGAYPRCSQHTHATLTATGCPVAVAAGRVEAEQVAKIKRARDAAYRGLEAAGRLLDPVREERDALRAVVEQVRAEATWRAGDGCPTGQSFLDLLPEPVE